MKTGSVGLEKPRLRVGDTTGTMVRARLCVLGRFSLELAQVTAPSLATQKARAILAYLVAHRQSDVARERLLEIFWPDAVPASAKDGLRSALWSIRRSVKDAGLDPNDYLVANRAKVRWTADAWYDAEAFLDLAKSDDVIDLEAAFALYQGDFIEGDYEQWTVAERERIGEVYESVLARLVRETQNREAAQLLVARNPYDEPSYLLLIEDEISAGRVGAAAALADRCQQALAELRSQPSPDLQRLLSKIAKRQQLRAVSKPVLPFVGRAAELAAAREYLQEPLPGRVFVLSGDAGIGKSTFLSHVADIARDVGQRTVTVQCSDTDTRLFGPFEELHADLYGEPFDPHASGQCSPAQRLAEAVFDALDPSVLLCVDDAHALTSDAMQVLYALARCACAAQRRLIVATRTEGLKDVISAVNGCAFETIVLGALDFNELRAGIDSLVPDDNAHLAATVFERSGGHPLFAGTLLDSLAQSGVLRSELGVWRLDGALNGQIALPESLKTYIEARLRARGANPSTVAAALAIEPAATIDDLTAVLRLSEEQLCSAIDDLLSLGVLLQTDSAPQLVFTHDLYREVAAKTLNPARRLRLNRAFGELFLQSSGADAALKCARHLALAGDPMRAAEAYFRAASEALEGRAVLEARDRCAAGIAGLESLERRPPAEAWLARLQMLLAKADAALGDSSAARANANESFLLAKHLGDSDTAIQAALARQSVIRDEYDASSALGGAREIASLAADAHDDAVLAVALADQSWAHRLLGSEAEAVKTARESARIAEMLDNPNLLCYALEQRILAAITWWRFEDAIDIAARCPEMTMRAGRLACSMLECAVAWLHFALEDRRGASSALQTALASFEQDARAPSRMPMPELFSLTRVRFALTAMSAQLALAEGRNQSALNAAEQLSGLPSPRARQVAELLRIDAQFESGNIAPPFTAALFTGSTLVFLQDVLSGSRAPGIAQALEAAATRAADARERVVEALDRIEAAGRRTPLLADHAFAQIARAAEKCGASSVAVRAALRNNDYGTARAVAISRIKISDRLASKNA